MVLGILSQQAKTEAYLWQLLRFKWETSEWLYTCHSAWGLGDKVQSQRESKQDFITFVVIPSCLSLLLGLHLHHCIWPLLYLSEFLLFLNFYLWMWMCMCHGEHVGVRRHFSEVRSYLPLFWRRVFAAMETSFHWRRAIPISHECCDYRCTWLFIWVLATELGLLDLYG